MTKAQAREQWVLSVVKHRGKYYTLENGRWVRAMSFAAFWKTVQRLNRLRASDPGGNIVL